MKEIVTKLSSGYNKVTRFALTQLGVSVSTFTTRKGNQSGTGDVVTEQLQNVYQTDYSYDLSDIVSEQDNWLDVEISVYKQIALYNPTLEIINPFSENTRLLVIVDKYTIKVFNIGGLTGIISFDFMENDELIGNTENPEDESRYFKSNGFRAVDINGKLSPVILNPRDVSLPATVTLKILGNIDPAASGIFRMTVRADI